MKNESVFESHSINIDNRRESVLTGIDDVLGFDEWSVIMHSSMGELVLEGEELKINSFSSEKGILTVSGKITGLFYSDNDAKKHSPKKRSSKI